MEEKAPAGVHDHEEEEEDTDDDDDALSLSDLPTTPIDQINAPSTRKILPRRSSSEPADFFEFLHSDDSIMMSHAEDIFFCGKLVPFDPHPHPHQQQMKRQSFYRRRSESFPDPIIMKPRGGGGGGGGSGTRTEEVLPLIRRKKLRRNFSTLSEKTLIRSNNPSTKSEISTKSSINFTPKHTASATATASRWLFLIFGFVKPLPPEMDLSDIKNRQVRRTPTTMFPPHIVNAGGGNRPNPSPGRRRRPWEGKRRSSWGLLSVLSCRSNTSVDVTTPFSCMPKI